MRRRQGIADGIAGAVVDITEDVEADRLGQLVDRWIEPAQIEAELGVEDRHQPGIKRGSLAGAAEACLASIEYDPITVGIARDVGHAAATCLAVIDGWRNAGADLPGRQGEDQIAGGVGHRADAAAGGAPDTVRVDPRY